MTNPTPNAKGEYINCVFHKPRSCAALKRWYNSAEGERCKGCVFFKTREQFEEERIRYLQLNLARDGS